MDAVEVKVASEEGKKALDVLTELAMRAAKSHKLATWFADICRSAFSMGCAKTVGEHAEMTSEQFKFVMRRKPHFEACHKSVQSTLATLFGDRQDSIKCEEMATQEACEKIAGNAFAAGVEHATKRIARWHREHPATPAPEAAQASTEQSSGS